MNMPTTQPGPVLLITDLSPRCDRAMDRAVSVTQRLGTSLIALHVMDTPWLKKLAQPDWASLQQENIREAEKRLRTDLAHANVAIEVRVEVGNPIEVIERVAKDQGCSLVVSGTARDETLGRIVLGNTVERLARRAVAPLLVVRARPFAPYGKIVVATDFSEGSRHALATGVDLFGGGQVTLYHAFEQVAGIYELDAPTVSEEKAVLKSKAVAFGQSVPGVNANTHDVVIEHGSAENLLPAYAASHEVELVIMGTHGATGLTRSAMGSIAEKLLASLRCDVLIVPPATSPINR